MIMKTSYSRVAAASVTAAFLCSGLAARANDPELQERIRQLEQRIAELEIRNGERPGHPDSDRKWLEEIEFSGFVSGSYFYNARRPGSRMNVGRGFDDRHNEFNANKVKLALERPVEQTGEFWDAGFRADLIFGEDAGLIHSEGLALGSHGDLQQAYVAVNVPVGTGLVVRGGKWVTMMGLEVIEEVDNPNWSLGNQCMYVENYTGTGIRLDYNWTEWLNTEVALFNGWDVVRDGNRGKSVMGAVTFTPDDATSLMLLGYGGPEQPDDTSAWRKGAQVLAGRELTPQLSAWVQLDYGHEDANAALPKAGDAEWYAAGLWLAYDFTEKVGVAFRGDYLKDKDGARTSGERGFPDHIGQNLYSLTLTLNLRPLERLQVRPEIRWDRSNLEGAFNGRKDQFTAGVGVAYLF
jgi:hypothetical protein